jgi:hypothetical protein
MKYIFQHDNLNISIINTYLLIASRYFIYIIDLINFSPKYLLLNTFKNNYKICILMYRKSSSIKQKIGYSKIGDANQPKIPKFKADRVILSKF